MVEERYYHRIKALMGWMTKSGYLVYLPTAYAETERRWPLLLSLHGSGESGSDLNVVAAVGLPRRAHQVDLPFVIVAPQCPKISDWTYPGQQRRLSALVDQVAKRYRVDEKRIYLTGTSMGGYAVWDLAMTQPHRFAAIAPICGLGTRKRVNKIKHLPIWVFQGEEDPYVSAHRVRRLVEALRVCGSPVKYTEYPDAGHDVWTRTYQDPRLFEWLLEHSLPGEGE